MNVKSFMLMAALVVGVAPVSSMVAENNKPKITHVSHDTKKKVKKAINKVAEESKTLVRTAVEKTKEVAGNAKDGVVKAAGCAKCFVVNSANKVVDVVKAHPYIAITAATVAALATAAGIYYATQADEEEATA